MNLQKNISGAPEGQDVRILARLAGEAMRDDRVIIHVAMDDVRVAEIKELLSFFAPDVKVIDFLGWDCLPYDRVSPSVDIAARRMTARMRAASSRMPYGLVR